MIKLYGKCLWIQVASRGLVSGRAACANKRIKIISERQMVGRLENHYRKELICRQASQQHFNSQVLLDLGYCS